MLVKKYMYIKTLTIGETYSNKVIYNKYIKITYSCKNGFLFGCIYCMEEWYGSSCKIAFTLKFLTKLTCYLWTFLKW